MFFFYDLRVGRRAERSSDGCTYHLKAKARDMRETPKVKWLAAGEREERCGERPTATRKVISNIGARSPVGICQG